MKPKVLCLLHRVPPAYGVTLLNEDIISSRAVNKDYDLDVIAINTAKQFREINKSSFSKVFEFLKIYTRVFNRLVFGYHHLCYMSLTPSGIGFVKDSLLVLSVKMFRLPIIFHIHGEGISQKVGMFKKMLYRMCLKNATVIIPVKILEEGLAGYVDPKDIVVLPNAVKYSVNEIILKEIQEKRQPGAKLRLICLSNMVQSKGIYVALDVARILAERRFDFELQFAGQWYDIRRSDFWLKVDEMGLAQYVKYLGFLQGEEKFQALLAADIFVYPTLKDIFGLVNIEAMQCHLPVVTTKEGGIPEVVKDGVTGFIVEKNEPEVMADRIVQLMEDPQLREKMGKAGRVRYLENYTFERFEEQLVLIFKSRIKA